MVKEINLEKDFLGELNEAINNKEDIQFRVIGEQRQGMSASALSLGHYYKSLGGGYNGKLDIRSS